MIVFVLSSCLVHNHVSGIATLLSLGLLLLKTRAACEAMELIKLICLQYWWKKQMNLCYTRMIYIAFATCMGNRYIVSKTTLIRTFWFQFSLPWVAFDIVTFGWLLPSFGLHAAFDLFKLHPVLLTNQPDLIKWS